MNNGKNYTVVEVTKDNCKEIFDMLYEGSAMTVQGLMMEELDKYIEFFKENCGLHDGCTVYHYVGKVYNDYYKTTGKKRYPAKLNNISIKLDDMDNCMGARFMIRWFDDIVANDTMM